MAIDEKLDALVVANGPNPRTDSVHHEDAKNAKSGRKVFSFRAPMLQCDRIVQAALKINHEVIHELTVAADKSAICRAVVIPAGGNPGLFTNRMSLNTRPLSVLRTCFHGHDRMYPAEL